MGVGNLFTFNQQVKIMHLLFLIMLTSLICFGETRVNCGGFEAESCYMCAYKDEDNFRDHNGAMATASGMKNINFVSAVLSKMIKDLPIDKNKKNMNTGEGVSWPEKFL